MVDKDRVAEPPPAHLNILTKQSRRQLSTIERLQEAHLRLGHPSFDSLVYMSKKGLLNDLPTLTHEMPIVCKACFHHNRTRIPKNPPDHSRPPIMDRLSCDFTFYSTLSLRGHKSALPLLTKLLGIPLLFLAALNGPLSPLSSSSLAAFGIWVLILWCLKWMKVANFVNPRNFVTLWLS